AGVDCGVDPATCEKGVVGQRPPTPVLDMLSETQYASLREADSAMFGSINFTT
ncbi:MAG: hypothetical protein HY661_17575, partial [Betaproteobacteria bacterium]|nr:hypothetical protein [Betaproteobacteria bacterium]